MGESNPELRHIGLLFCGLLVIAILITLAIEIYHKPITDKADKWCKENGYEGVYGNSDYCVKNECHTNVIGVEKCEMTTELIP